MNQKQIYTIPRGHQIAKNVVWNLSGQIIPILAAVFFIPFILKQLGAERFGILTLAWTTVGYFSLFDLGMGRAVTQLVSEKIAEKKENDAYRFVWNSFWALSVLGFAGGAVVWFLSPLLVERLLKISPTLQAESLIAFRVMAWGIPLVTMTNVLNGVLSAHQRFFLINLISIPQGILNFAGTLFVLIFTQNLAWVVLVIVVTRFAGLIAYFYFCFADIPQLKKVQMADGNSLKLLLGIGGWMTVSNIIGPLMVTFDRYFIGMVISAVAVAYYVTPYEATTKILILAGALMKVLFPAFSASYRADPKRLFRLYQSGIKYLFLIVLIPVFIAVVWASDILGLWLGKDFATHSFRVMQIIGIGVFLNTLAQVPFSFLQGMGRPDITAKIHLFECPLYVLILWLLLTKFGIVGGALAWTIRILLDSILLFAFVEIQAKATSEFNRRLAGWAIGTVFVMGINAIIPGFWCRTFLGVVLLGIMVILTWLKFFDSDERQVLLENTRKLAGLGNISA